MIDSYNVLILLILVILLSILGLVINKPKKITIDKYSIFSLALGLLVALGLTYWSPYPYIYDTDIFRHLIFIENILSGQFIYIPAYLPSFHILVALVSKIFFLEENIYPVLWSLRFIFIPFYSLGIFLFVSKVVKNKNLSLLVAFLAPLIIIEYSSLINSAPKILSYVILPYFLYLLWDIKNKKILTLVIIIITSLLIHWPMGLVNLAIILSFIFFKYLYQKNPKVISRIIFIIFLLSLAFLLLQAFQILNLNQISLSIFGEVDLNKYNFNSHFDNLLVYFPPFILGLSSLGILFYRRSPVISFLPGLFLVLCIHFIPLNASHRSLISIIPLIILFLSLAILQVYKLINNKFFKYLFILTLLILLPISFSKAYYEQIIEISSLKENQGNYTIISPEEFTSAYWLQNNILEDYYIISDPVNTTFLVGVTKAEPLLTGEEAMSAVMQERDSKKTREYLKNKSKEKKVLIFIDGRTSYWVLNKDKKDVFNAPNQARPFKEFNYFKKFKDKEYFNIIYQENGVYIIEVN